MQLKIGKQRKKKMLEWKDKVIHEMTRKLLHIQRTNREEIETQRQGFQLELEQVKQGFQIELREACGKMEQMENKVRALRSSGRFTTWNPPSAKAMAKSSSVNQDEKIKSLTKDLRPAEERSQ